MLLSTTSKKYAHIPKIGKVTFSYRRNKTVSEGQSIP
jgi:hypothetical protein